MKNRACKNDLVSLAALADIVRPLGSLGAWIRQRVGIHPTWRHTHTRELAEKMSGNALSSIARNLDVCNTGFYRPTTVSEGLNLKGEKCGEPSSGTAVYSRHRCSEGSPRGGRVEFPQSGKSRSRLYAGLALEKAGGSCEWTAGDRLIPYAQMGKGARLPLNQRTLGLHRQPNRRALCLRMAR